jgi:hypothetical protein
MASQDPRIRQLELLAEKQMKSTLHARFLDNCRAEDVVPKGLQLKLKVNVGKDSDDLQNSIDSLLLKVSKDICERVRGDHIRRSHDYGRLIEEKRNDLKTDLNNEELFKIDCDIFERTEKKKEDVLLTHEKKLKFLIEASFQIKTSIISNNTDDEEYNDEIVVTTTKQDKTTAKNGGQVKRAKKVQNVKSKPTKKTPTFRSMDTNTQNTRQPVKPKTSIETSCPSSSPEVEVSKNLQAPGTRKTYAEAIKHGAPQENNSLKLQKTLELLTKMVTDLLAVTPTGNAGRDDLSEWQTRRHGGHSKGGFKRYRKGSRQS